MEAVDALSRNTMEQVEGQSVRDGLSPGQAHRPGRARREYRSRLFTFLFGREENKDWTLELYNAVSGSRCMDPDAITINTIEDVIYLGMQNDLAFLVSSEATMYRSQHLYEHQSTLNPNMPIRELMYAGKMYDRYLYLSRRNRYGRKLVPLPIPKLVVLYNGEDETGDEAVLCLSDAYREEIRQGLRASGFDRSGEALEEEIERILREADPDIEARVRMININYGRSRKVLKACKPLEEYAWFVDRVRQNNRPDAEGKRIGIEAAVDRAVEEMPEEFVIRELLVKNRVEVKDMCLTEYNEREVMELFREEGREEGQKEGREDALAASIRNVMKAFGVTAERAMESLEIPAAERSRFAAMLDG